MILSNSSCSHFEQALLFRPESFFAEHVRSLCIKGAPFEHALDALRVCTGVQNLAWWFTAPGVEPFNEKNAITALELVRSLHIHKLSIDCQFMFAQFCRQEYAQPAYQSLTHLNAGIYCVDGPGFQFLADLPLLFHLSIFFGLEAENQAERCVEEILNICGKRLRIFIISTDITLLGRFWDEITKRSAPLIEVTTPLDIEADWGNFGNGEEDLWLRTVTVL